MEKKPTLHKTCAHNNYKKQVWTLDYHEGPVSVCLEIDFHYATENPNHYTILAAHEDEQRNSNTHGYREVITQEELECRYETVMMHEGRKAADRWLKDAPDRFMVIGKYNKIFRIANELMGRWEALQTIVNPAVTF